MYIYSRLHLLYMTLFKFEQKERNDSDQCPIYYKGPKKESFHIEKEVYKTS